MVGVLARDFLQFQRECRGSVYLHLRSPGDLARVNRVVQLKGAAEDPAYWPLRKQAQDMGHEIENNSSWF